MVWYRILAWKTAGCVWRPDPGDSPVPMISAETGVGLQHQTQINLPICYLGYILWFTLET